MIGFICPQAFIISVRLIEKFMAEKVYDILSPDGFPITPEPFNSEQEAWAAASEWCQRFERQGHYRTNEWERIPFEKLRFHLRLLESESLDARMSNVARLL